MCADVLAPDDDDGGEGEVCARGALPYGEGAAPAKRPCLDQRVRGVHTPPPCHVPPPSPTDITPVNMDDIRREYRMMCDAGWPDDAPPRVCNQAHYLMDRAAGLVRFYQLQTSIALEHEARALSVEHVRGLEYADAAETLWHAVVADQVLLVLSPADIMRLAGRIMRNALYDGIPAHVRREIAALEEGGYGV